MAKTLFDIAVVQPPDESPDSHLVMEISARIFSYALADSDKKLQHLRFYELDARNNQELAEELRGILTADTMLQTNRARKTFVYNFPESNLVPENYFDAAAGKEFIELFYGDLNKGITLSERIPGLPEYNVFRVPAEVHSLLQRSFTNSKYWHYYSLWMQQEQKEPVRHSTYLTVIFYPNRLLVAAVKDKQLHLLQSYSYEAAEDVGYYLLNICGQLQLAAADTPVVVSGMIDVSSVLYTEICKYFMVVELEDATEIIQSPALRDYPPHFFSPLLKLAACVS